MKWYHVSPIILQKLIWIPTRLTLAVFGRLDVRGLEHVAGLKGNVIFAANHASEIDPFIVPATLPFSSRHTPIFYAVREKSFYDESGWRKHLFGGTFINMWGGYPVFVGMRDYGKSLLFHLRILTEGGDLCVFPEGGRSPDGTIQPAKGGVAYLMHAASRHVVPVAISGAFRTKPIDFFLRRRKITVVYGKPISPAEATAAVPGDPSDPAVYKRQANYIMSKVRELLVPERTAEKAYPGAKEAGERMLEGLEGEAA